ncbi:MAG: DegT/DnrJ/EryC1/StrS family aminotransferase [Planctomycetaceae bacterium]
MPDPPFLLQANPHAGYLARKAEIDAAIARVLANGRYILGPEVATFEKEFAHWLEVAGTVGVASGTDAVEIALRALEIGPGDGVITVSHTAVATVAAIERAGATPILIDIDRTTYTMSPLALESELNRASIQCGVRPKAIVPVHIYGQPAEIEQICRIAKRFSLFVIEDCAQAHGAAVGDRKVGTFGDLAAYSFYPTKNLAALGDGGLVAGNNADLLARVRSIREYGWKDRYVSAIAGVNSRLDEMQAAILRVGLAHLDADNRRRAEIAQRYSQELSGTSLQLPKVRDGVRPVWHQYVVECDDRESLRKSLEAAGIGTGIHYPVPVHRQPAYLNRASCPSPLVETERVASRILSLPMYPQLSNADVDRVIAAIMDGLDRVPKTASEGRAS